MGKAVSAVTKPVAGLTGSVLGGLNPITNMFGLSMDKGSQGEYYTPEQQQSQKYRDFANDYDTAMQLANQSTLESPFTRDLFLPDGKGLASRLASEEQQLASQGFQLTPEDMTAYGQASGDISRLFGQQENAAAQGLQRRGLGAASSGAAGATFSGLAGNKNEMLAKVQTDIAQKRMADTMTRLNNTRNQMQSLGAMGQSIAQQRYDARGNSLLNSVNAEAGLNAQMRQSAADKKAAYNPSLLESIGQGLQGGVTNLAQAAPGYAVGGMGGAASSAGGAQAQPAAKPPGGFGYY